MRVLPRRMALHRARISLLLTHEQRPSTNDILRSLLGRCVERLMGRSPFNGGWWCRLGLRNPTLLGSSCQQASELPSSLACLPLTQHSRPWPKSCTRDETCLPWRAKWPKEAKDALRRLILLSRGVCCVGRRGGKKGRVRRCGEARLPSRPEVPCLPRARVLSEGRRPARPGGWFHQNCTVRSCLASAHGDLGTA